MDLDQTCFSVPFEEEKKSSDFGDLDLVFKVSKKWMFFKQAVITKSYKNGIFTSERSVNIPFDEPFASAREIYY